MPQGGLAALEQQDPLAILAYQYDIVCNGVELSSGAIRNHRPEIMYKAFEIAGYSAAEVEERFGGMLNAFKYGAPPHGGSAPGIDRIVMLLADTPNLREIVAFPMNQQAQDLLLHAPAPVPPERLRELHIRLALPPGRNRDLEPALTRATANFASEQVAHADPRPAVSVVLAQAALEYSPCAAVAVRSSEPRSAQAAEIAPHRALYEMTLGSARNNSGVVDARGTMAYEWGETCDGWTVEQRYRLKMRYAEARDVDIASSLVTWESKDGSRYRFNQKQTRNGEVDQEVRGEAKLDGPGKGGVVEFSKPDQQTMKLEPGVLFPSAHTILLIEKAKSRRDPGFASGVRRIGRGKRRSGFGRDRPVRLPRARPTRSQTRCCSGPAGACDWHFFLPTLMPSAPITNLECVCSTTASRATW